MNLPVPGWNCLWAGLFSVCISVNMTAPPRHMAGTFLCGLSGRLVRDVLVASGLSPNWATVAGALVVVLLAAAIIRRHEVSPVVLVSAVIPLGASLAVFRTIFELIRVSTAEGDALRTSAVSLVANSGKVFTTSLAIALGLAAGMALLRVFGRKSGDVSA